MKNCVLKKKGEEKYIGTISLVSTREQAYKMNQEYAESTRTEHLSLIGENPNNWEVIKATTMQQVFVALWRGDKDTISSLKRIHFK